MDPLDTPRRLVWLRLMALVLPLVTGCGAQLKFVTVVAKTKPGPGGWQETCLEANVQNMTTGDSAVCPVTIGMPIETEANGYIGSWWAAEIAADCINEASELVIRPAPPESPSALVCMHFVDTVHEILNKRVVGSRVTQKCKPGIPVTRVGF
jgi:hypothetical protein